MQESCFCGRSGDIRERNPLLGSDGRRALECPDCGHPDYLEWLPKETNILVWEETQRRREVLADEERPDAYPAA